MRSWTGGLALLVMLPGIPGHVLAQDTAWIVGWSGDAMPDLPGVRVLEVVPELRIALVQGIFPRSPPPGTTFVSPLGVVRPADAHAPDPLMEGQYAVQALNLTPAWERTRGQGVLVAVLDSGLDAAHPDLATTRIVRSRDALLDGATGDACGHGTSVAGLVSAGLRNGVGIAGAAPGADLLPLRVLGFPHRPCEGNTFVLARGLVATAHARADVAVISLSVGGPGAETPPEIALALEYAAKRGVLLVAASGNTAGGLATPPSTHPSVIAAGCTTPAGSVCAIGSRDARTRLHAPGEDVLTLLRGGGYGPATGTSFSAPYVASALALLRASCAALPAGDLPGLLLATGRPVPGAASGDARALDVGAALETGCPAPASAASS